MVLSYCRENSLTLDAGVYALRHEFWGSVWLLLIVRGQRRWLKLKSTKILLTQLNIRIEKLNVQSRCLLWDPTSVGKENETFFIRVWKPLPNIPVLKTLKESSNECQRGCWALKEGGLWDSTLVEEENETFFYKGVETSP